MTACRTALKPTYAHNMRLIGHSDQAGRSDGQQIMVRNGYAYIGHVCSKGFSVIDVRDPRESEDRRLCPEPAEHLEPASAGPRRPPAARARPRHVLASRNGRRAQLLQAAVRLARRPCRRAQRATGRPEWRSSTFRKPDAPRQIGFMPVDGAGLHRIWYVGGRWAYASAMIDGFSDYILVTIDMADPTKPEIVGRYWLPGMNLAAGETANWPLERGRYGLHHAVVADDIAYCAWRDGCLASVDVTDKANPKLIVHRELVAAVRRRHPQLPAADRPESADRARRSGARQHGGRFQADLGVRQPGEVEPDQHRDLPAARRTATTSPSAAISGRTTSTRTGRAASRARA